MDVTIGEALGAADQMLASLAAGEQLRPFYAKVL